MSIETLQICWWIIVSILGSLVVFLLFVQGGQTLLYAIGKTGPEREILVNSLGQKWAFAFAAIMLFGGAVFASFPLLGFTVFGGINWLWMAIPALLIVQTLTFEFRFRPTSFAGQIAHEWFLIINGFLGILFIGTAVATFFTGSPFSADKSDLTNMIDAATLQWQHPAHGLEALLNWRNISLGLAVFFLARVLGILFYMNTIDDEMIAARLKRHAIINTLPFLVFFLVFISIILSMPGFAVRPQDQFVFGVSNKYFHNLIQMPVVAILLSAGVVFVLLGSALPLANYAKNAPSGIWYAGIGSILIVFSLFCLAGLNNTAYYPSVFNLQSSLTIRNSSSSYSTLSVMSYISLIIPVILAAVWYARKATRKKNDAAEMMG